MTTAAPQSPPRAIAAFNIPLAVKLWTPNRRGHWRERARVTKLIREVAFHHGRQLTLRHADALANGQHRRVNLCLRLGKGDRTMDDDNLIGGLKPARDGLVDAGLIVDDSPKWATFTYHQMRARDGQRKVAVTIYEVGDDG